MATAAAVPKKLLAGPRRPVVRVRPPGGRLPPADSEAAALFAASRAAAAVKPAEPSFCNRLLMCCRLLEGLWYACVASPTKAYMLFSWGWLIQYS